MHEKCIQDLSIHTIIIYIVGNIIFTAVHLCITYGLSLSAEICMKFGILCSRKSAGMEVLMSTSDFLLRFSLGNSTFLLVIHRGQGGLQDINCLPMNGNHYQCSERMNTLYHLELRSHNHYVYTYVCGMSSTTQIASMEVQICLQTLTDVHL